MQRPRLLLDIPHSMRAHILGSSAGGGLPQWNCGCRNCSLARAGDARIAARTQDSIAVGSGGSSWLLVNASPDVLRQIEHFEPLWPRAPRHTPIAAIALLNGDLDHVLGLLSLREWQPLRLLATARVHAGLVAHNAMLRTLVRTPEQSLWTQLELGKEVGLDDLGIAVTALPAPGKLPVHLVGLVDPSPEDNVALRVRDLGTKRTMVVATAVGSLDGIGAIADGADALLFDGTFFREDELVSQGLGCARASDMAHVPVGGEEGSLARVKTRASQRIYTHINNTNPMLLADSPERAAVERAGWQIAFDGMEVAL
jgi:pyrroloquinoline quinone biosynthesis protein B